jgi:hypothetical protein
MYPYYAGVGMLSLMGLLILFTILLMITKHKCIAFFYGFFMLLGFLILAAIGTGFIYMLIKGPDYLGTQCSDPNS